MKVAILTNLNIPDKLSVAEQVVKIVKDAGGEPLVNSYFRYPIEHSAVLRGIKSLPLDPIYQDADLIITIGGDGTILDTAKRSAVRGTPVLGVNMGKLGYIAEIESTELELIKKVMSGNYSIDTRSMINVQSINTKGEEKNISLALNEAMIENALRSKIVDLELYENNRFVCKVRANGIMVATPTGSTAYSLAAGGPIVDPKVGCLCVTAVCSQNLGIRPMLFSDSSVIEIKNVYFREKNLCLTIDGKHFFELPSNHTVRILKSDLHVNFIRVKDSAFYSKMTLQ